MLRFSLAAADLHRGEHRVLQGVSLQIREGEKVALLGRSGVGKTTLLERLYHQCPEAIALCPQAQGLVDSLSVFHNVYMGQLDQHHSLYNLANLIWPLPGPKRAVASLCSELGLAAKLMTPVARLSGGQRQRTALGRALYRQRRVFLGDEPVSALDPVQGEQLLRWTLSRHDTAVVALHDVALARHCFDRVIGLAEGQVRFDCATAALDDAQVAQLYL
ncbi:ATP-binding cassette domain-containing protein [Ferrimonas balearica]|uniref:ATP-binding cassette domain-containing protein n=1 Tax=Ferrimonas balearica TaxID=44012 RepID=UPI001C99A2B9|nr:ATP-binding cassette domain-containing protein [Ferrimonas balearica]MBY5991826.1 ATP-binding cassette domain-containing protein [Ferrimonas balearica]